MTNNLFLFTGSETFLLRQQAKSWKEAFIKKHGDINLITLDGAETPLGEIMSAIESVPFLGERRLIFIEGLPEEPKTKNTDTITKKDEERDGKLKKLLEYLENVQESSVVVFVQPNPDKRRNFYKKLVKLATVKEFAQLSSPALSQWVRNQAQKKGVSISSSSADYLISLTGQNLWRLDQEIAKVTHYAPRQPITKVIIDQVVVPTLEANIFHFTDALGAKNHRQAIQNLHRSMAAGENIRQLFYMIVRQFRLFLQVSSYISNNPNASSATVAAALKIHPFVARNIAEQLRRFNLSEIHGAHGRLLEIDMALKTSRIRITTEDQDELALAIEKFILRFCCN